MFAELVVGGEGDGRTNEQHGLHLLTGKDDLVRGSDAVDVRRAVGDGEVARVDHTEIDVQRFPEVIRAGGAGFITFTAGIEAPGLAHIDRVDVFEAVLMQAADGRLKPWIKYNRAEGAEEIADSI